MSKEKETYQKIEKIGEGTYGTVYKAKETKTGKIVALKKIKIEEKEGIPPTTIREISLLKSLSHPSIVHLIDVFYTKNRLYMAMEYYPIDLRKFIDETRKKKEKISLKIINKLIYQILQALEYCHSRGVMHRDIKPQNILLDDQYNVKLADFGLARSVSVPLRTFTQEVVTLWYRPPELILNTKYYSESIDIWSAGTIFCELFTLHPLFAGDSEVDQLVKIIKILGTPIEETWEGLNELIKNFTLEVPFTQGLGLNSVLSVNDSFLDLISQMFIYDPVKRISAKKALSHEYFKDYIDF